MPKVVLNIFETKSEGKKVYRAVIQIGENPEPVSMGTIVYQDGEEIGSREKNEIIRQLKDKAKKWTMEQVDENGQPLILFVHNLDINPYD